MFPHLPSHAIGTFCVEYTYPYTDKIFVWARGMVGGEHTFIKIFHFPICFIVKTEYYEQKYDQSHFFEFTWKVIYI